MQAKQNSLSPGEGVNLCVCVFGWAGPRVPARVSMRTVAHLYACVQAQEEELSPPAGGCQPGGEALSLCFPSVPSSLCSCDVNDTGCDAFSKA